eukprot:gene9265-19228_t
MKYIVDTVLDVLRRKMIQILMDSRSNGMVEKFQMYCGVMENGSSNRSLVHSYFKLSSALGEDIFYLIPFLVWTAIEIGIPFLTNFGIVLMTGQILKDIFQLPRPVYLNTGHKIVVLEKNFETEFGMPSTHTISGMLPIVILLSLQRLGYTILPQYWIAIAIWSSSVALSRLYMGVHSPLDIISGGIIGAVLISTIHYYDNIIETILYKSKYGIFISTIFLFLFLFLYPKPDPWRASYGTSATIFGVWNGASFSLWILYNVFPSLLHVFQTSSILHNHTHILTTSAMCRVIIGMILSGVAYITTKRISTYLFLHLASTIRGTLLDPLGRIVPLLRRYEVEVPVRFLTYSMLAFTSIVIVPSIWILLELV